jgi:hypothetical protein
MNHSWSLSGRANNIINLTRYNPKLNIFVHYSFDPEVRTGENQHNCYVWLLNIFMIDYDLNFTRDP